MEIRNPWKILVLESTIPVEPDFIFSVIDGGFIEENENPNIGIPDFLEKLIDYANLVLFHFFDLNIAPIFLFLIQKGHKR